MRKTRRSRKKKKPAAEPAVKQEQPDFNMAEPNDDMAAFGWDLGRLRYKSKDSTKNDIWPGRSMFEIEEAEDLVDTYGYNIEFINPKFLQIMLDVSPAVRRQLIAVKRANYSPRALSKLAAVISKVVEEDIVPEMLQRLSGVMPAIAQFYAARLAHVDKFGADA